MTIQDIEKLCWKRYNELLQEHFGDFAAEAAGGKTTHLSNHYTDTLPLEIASTFRSYLKELWNKSVPDGACSFEDIMNTKKASDVTSVDYADYLPQAREAAETVTWWEKITRSNHEDVTYYKGLLKQYSEELMGILIRDFIKDVEIVLPNEG